MGKYYSRHGNVLFVYVTGHDKMVDFSLFPPELDLFSENRRVRMKEKISSMESSDNSTLDKAELILAMNGFKKKEQSIETLQHYFTFGDESKIENETFRRSKIKPQQGEATAIGEDEIIIPDFPSYQLNHQRRPSFEQRNEADSEKPEQEALPPCITDSEWEPASEEELIKNLVDCMESRGFTYRYKYTPPNEEIQRRRDAITEPSPQLNEEILKLLTEIVKLLTQVTRDRRDEFEYILKRDELMKNLNEYIKLQKESRKPKTDIAIAPLDDEPLKSKRPSVKKYPDEVVKLLMALKDNR